MKTLTKKQRALRNNLTAWILVAPSLIFMLVFTVYPVFRSIYLSLTRYRLGMQAPEFVGLENYINLFGSSLFWKVMGNTLFFALITIIPSMAAGLFLATLVNRKSRSIGFVRTAFFYPVVMPMIAIASIWMFIYMAKNGLFDQMLVSLGLEPMNVLSNKSTVLPAMAVMYVWKEAGYLMVFFLSGIQSISDEVNEAARIDGCGVFRSFFKIMIPTIKTGIITVVVISFLNGWNDLIYSMTFNVDADMRPLTANIRKFQSKYGTKWNCIMAYGAILVIPVILAFVFLQKYIVGGLTAGAVKE